MMIILGITISLQMIGIIAATVATHAADFDGPRFCVKR